MRTRILLAVFSFLSMAAFAFGQQYPTAQGYVSDFAQALPKTTADALSADLAAFEKRTSVEIAVVTVNSLDGLDIETYARGLGSVWGVGKREKNNGIIFLVAPKQHVMRIEVASGANSTLTNRRADRIRDSVILPRFKAGDMAGGIVGGTRAIMRVFDESPASPAQTSASKNDFVWTSDDTKRFGIVIAVLLGVVLLLIIAVTLVGRSQARREVMAQKKDFAEGLKRAEDSAKSSDVKEATHAKLSKIRGEFSEIDRLTPESEGVDWIAIREKLESLDWDLDDVASTVKKELAFAERAREEGPRLMQELPAMIEAAEKKLAEGKSSPEAAKHLEEARRQYAVAQSQQSGMTMMDWVILYALLSNASSSCERAETAHDWTNTDHSDESSYRSSESPRGSDDSSSFSGFSGGGGFGGGGTSGSW